LSPTNTFDLVVVGSGIAGQTAALTAAEAGLSVLMLEKTARLGGSSAMSGGWFAFTGTEEQAAEGVADSTELFRRDLLELGNHLNDKTLVEAYLEHQLETYRWLKSHGVLFREVEISSGQSARRSHNTAITEVLAGLHRDYAGLGGHVRTEHRANGLLRDPAGQVIGVRASTPEGEAEFLGRAGVILATGGFSRSRELLKVFAPEQLAAIPYGGRGNTGDGLRMAWKLGAGMADMSFVSATYGSHPETGEDFHELLTAYYLGAIIVNQHGRRFVDESQDYKTLGRIVLQQPDGLGIQVFDAKTRAKSHRGIPLKDIDTLEDIGHLHKADTLEELASAAGVDSGALVETVGQYNSAARGERPDLWGRTSLCNGVGAPAPIDTPPFYAYPAKPLMTTTYCGVTISPAAEVIDVDGDAIPGLYAIGELTGGFHGAAYMTGTSLGKGAVFGRIAALQAANSLTAPDESTDAAESAPAYPHKDIR
jgi:fumarate reductase flavoprotein subunit